MSSSEWSHYDQHFCEGFDHQPGSPEWVSIFTSISFTFYGILGIYNLLKIKSHRDLVQLGLIFDTTLSYSYYLIFISLIWEGINSAIYHATLLKLWGSIDSGMTLLIIIPLCHEMINTVYKSKSFGILNVPMWIEIILVSLTIQIGVVFAVIFTMESGHIYSSVIFSAIIIFVIICIIYLLVKTPQMNNFSQQTFRSSLVYLSLAVIFLIVFELICSTSSLSFDSRIALSHVPTHGLWHIMLSMGTYNAIIAIMLNCHENLDKMTYNFGDLKYQKGVVLFLDYTCPQIRLRPPT
jgi:hypothetical protein